MALNIAVIYGSVREERQGIRAARFFVSQVEKAGHKAVLIDPMEYPHPLLDKRYFEYDAGKAPKVMQKVSKLLLDADAYVIVSGEYNHSVPPALNNLLDHYYAEYSHKISAIVTYSGGAFGGVRNLPNLRALLGELGCPGIQQHFPIPKVQEAFDEKGVAADPAYVKRAEKFIAELAWHAEALKAARAKGVPK